MPIFKAILEKIKKHSYVCLNEIVEFSKEVTDFSEFHSGTFEYLEISGISLGINQYQTTTVNIEEAPSRAKMKTQKDDIVVSLTRPHRGAIAKIKDDKIIASTGFSVIRKVKNGFNRQWLIYTLFCNISLQQMLQRSSGGNYPAIIEDELKKICIPKIEYSIQKKMVAELEKKLAIMNEKLQQADELVKEFKKFVEIQYGIQKSINTNSYFAIKYKDLDNVIDVKRYMIPKKENNFLVSNICNIVSEKTDISAYGNQIIDWIRIDDLPNNPMDIEIVRTQNASEVKGTFFKVQKGDILVARLGPTILNQKIVMVRDVKRETIASSEFLVLRCKKKYDAECVMAILKTFYFRDLMYSHTRGSTPSRYRLNREDMLKLPFPDIKDNQKTVSEKAMSVRNSIQVLRMEAEKEWKKAKAQFEKELLNK